MLAVPVVDDSLEEANETFTVRLREVRNATLLDGDGRATIVDDDDAGDGTPPPSGEPALSIDDVTLTEDVGSAAFRVSLSAPSTAAVTVAYTTADGTATAGFDYTAVAGTLTLQPGATQRTLAVPVVDDSEEEESETFTVRLRDPRNATLADGEGIATIRDRRSIAGHGVLRGRVIRGAGRRIRRRGGGSQCGVGPCGDDSPDSGAGCRRRPRRLLGSPGKLTLRLVRDQQEFRPRRRGGRGARRR